MAGTTIKQEPNNNKTLNPNKHLGRQGVGGAVACGRPRRISPRSSSKTRLGSSGHCGRAGSKAARVGLLRPGAKTHVGADRYPLLRELLGQFIEDIPRILLRA
eukprot:5985853-Pyramimonas_sp.AAC.1